MRQQKVGEASKGNLDEISSTKVVPGACENLENSSMEFQEGNPKTIESSEKRNSKQELRIITCSKCRRYMLP